MNILNAILRSAQTRHHSNVNASRASVGTWQFLEENLCLPLRSTSVHVLSAFQQFSGQNPRTLSNSSRTSNPLLRTNCLYHNSACVIKFNDLCCPYSCIILPLWNNFRISKLQLNQDSRGTIVLRRRQHGSIESSIGIRTYCRVSLFMQYPQTTCAK